VAVAPFIALNIAMGHFFNALLLLALGGFTDFLDGILARLLKQENRLGVYLDPAADKLLILACYLGLATAGFLPIWLAVLIIARDILIVSGVVFLKILRVPFKMLPSKISKITTFFQIITALSVLAMAVLHFTSASILLLLFVATALLTLISALDYIAIGYRAYKARC